MVEQLYNQNEINRWHANTGRPYVTLSWAQSLDGSLTLKQGASSPISCPDSLIMTHQLRSRHEGILVGIGTVLADNPSLTARLGVSKDCQQPRPIVLDSRLRIPADSRLFTYSACPIIATTAFATQEPRDNQNLKAEVLCLPATETGAIALKPLLIQLGKMGVRSVMVEGGGRVITSFLNAQVANQAIITIAPVFVGGYSAVHSFNQTRWQNLPRLIDMQTIPCGSDLIVTGRFEQSK
ncbi:MAG: riboflavin-specific deaminase-like protein [Cellvibrionaceae bacterium]|jgi:riboflavin-specific deaminase-like protein